MIFLYSAGCDIPSSIYYLYVLSLHFPKKLHFLSGSKQKTTHAKTVVKRSDALNCPGYRVFFDPLSPLRFFRTTYSHAFRTASHDVTLSIRTNLRTAGTQPKKITFSNPLPTKSLYLPKGLGNMERGAAPPFPLFTVLGYLPAHWPSHSSINVFAQLHNCLRIHGDM